MSRAPAQLFVLDRTRGLYRPFAELVPGGVYVPLGLDRDDAAVINPWDVADPIALPPGKVRFLTRLQALLVGGRESGRPLGLTPRERGLLTIAIRDVYARAADGEGSPSNSSLRAVLADLARQERVDPDGSQANAVAYEDLGRRLDEVCAGGPYGHLFDRPTRLEAGAAPLVVISTGAVAEEVVAAMLLAVFEFVSRLVERCAERPVALLADALDPVSPRRGDEQFPPAFPRDSLLNGLHESYMRRRMRAGETRAIAYLHAISDVAHFLHPPTALAESRPSRSSRPTTRSTS